MKAAYAMMLTLVILIAVPGMGLCQDLMVFPANGQTPEQMDKDKFECYNWAKQQSGFDPMQIPTAQTAPPPEKKPSGGMIKGGVKGAVVGTAFGAATGGSSKDTRRSARIGAGAGAVLGGARRNSSNQQQNQAQKDWEQQESANYMNQRNKYNRAYGACLEGKGYSVK